MQGLSAIWPSTRPLIGMVHLLPLPGAPRWGGSMDEVLDRALADARSLEGAGFDGLIVENYSDVPFHRGSVPAETIAGLTTALSAMCRTVSVPVGVNVLRNDALAAMGIAVATGARFIRVNVHVGSMWTDQGLIEGEAAETLRLRSALRADVAILADVHVKHASPPAGSRLADAAADAWHRGCADALIVSGSGTGHATHLSDVDEVCQAVPEARVLVGSGTSEESVRSVLQRAHGAIVGSAVMVGGTAGEGVDSERARSFIETARS